MAVREPVRDYYAAARWLALAEKRLAHLKEMFESGRWRRYYNEVEFLGLINESRAAVRSWRRLAAKPSEPLVAMPTASMLPPSPFDGQPVVFQQDNAAAG